MRNIITEFEGFMSRNGKSYSQFYVGIAADPIDRLRNGHSVNETIPHIYWNQPVHTDHIRSLEKYFLNKGTQGGPGGGDNNTKYIYAYLITNSTIE